MISLGWNLLPPLIKVFLKKEDKSLKECLSIFDYLLKVCLVFVSERYWLKLTYNGIVHQWVKHGFSGHCNLTVFSGFQVCRPKELLIGLLEQLEQDDPDAIAESILLLLIPLQKGKGSMRLSSCKHWDKTFLCCSCQCCYAWETTSLPLWAWPCPPSWTSWPNCLCLTPRSKRRMTYSCSVAAARNWWTLWDLLLVRQTNSPWEMGNRHWARRLVTKTLSCRRNCWSCKWKMRDYSIKHKRLACKILPRMQSNSLDLLLTSSLLLIVPCSAAVWRL